MRWSSYVLLLQAYGYIRYMYFSKAIRGFQLNLKLAAGLNKVTNCCHYQNEPIFNLRFETFFFNYFNLEKKLLTSPPDIADIFPSILGKTLYSHSASLHPGV